MTEERSEIGLAIEEGLREVLAWKRGEIALEMRNVDPMPVERIKEIRKRYAKSTKDFEKRFGIPSETMNNWEQGRRKPDPTARLLLKVIEQDPAAVEKAFAHA